MGFAPVADAVEAYVLAQIASVRPGIKVARENRELKPRPALIEPWLRLLVMESGSEHPFIGRPDVVRDIGIVSVECFAPLHSGTDTVRPLADDVRRIFTPADGLRVAAAGGVVAVFSYSSDAVPRIVHLGEVQDLGAWNKRTVLAPFLVDHAA